MNPTRPVVLPTGQISISGLRDLQRATRQAREVTAAPPLEVAQINGTPCVIDPRPPALWVHITGKQTLGSDYGSGDASGGSGDLPPDNWYSGQQMRTSRADVVAVDDPGGRTFWADALPLIEVTGNPDVPDGAIVRAFPGNTPDIYTFEYFPLLPCDDYYSGGGDCELTQTVTIRYFNQECCPRVLTICLPFKARVCDEPDGDCDSGSGVAGGA